VRLAGRLAALILGSLAAPAWADDAGRKPVIETIEETTVGDLDGTRVPMGNVTDGHYTLPDGTEKAGPICSLVLGDGPGTFVGAGSVIEVDGVKWTVLAVDHPPGALGSVTLQKND
jgi:hypothetical protein